MLDAYIGNPVMQNDTVTEGQTLGHDLFLFLSSLCSSSSKRKLGTKTPKSGGLNTWVLGFLDG